MSRSTTHRSADVAFNGKLLHWVNLGRMTAANSTQKFGWVSPCDGTIVAFQVLTVTQVSNAAARITLGTEAALTANLVSTDISAVAASIVDYTSALASATISRDTGYVFQLTSADTTGQISVGLIIEPR